MTILSGVENILDNRRETWEQKPFQRQVCFTAQRKDDNRNLEKSF